MQNAALTLSVAARVAASSFGQKIKLIVNLGQSHPRAVKYGRFILLMYFYPVVFKLTIATIKALFINNAMQFWRFFDPTQCLMSFMNAL